MSLLANSNAIESGGYNIDRSLRFRGSASAYLNRTPASASNRQICTWSGWIKRGDLIANQGVFGSYNGSDRGTFLIFNGSSGELQLYGFTVSGYDLRLVSSSVYRDVSAWYHIVMAIDTTQATASNRLKLYVNGVQITSFSTATYPSQNYNTYFNNNQSHTIGAESTGNRYFDGYLAEVNFIDGQALTPSSFGETDAITGVWQPKKYTGTYGTNGFYLDFKDNTSATTLAYDKSGNGNNWTPNNISTTAGATYDSMTDVPTLTSATAANYSVINALALPSGFVAADGNLSVSGSNASRPRARGTIAIPSTGQWYWEVSPTGTISNSYCFGVTGSPVTAGAFPDYAGDAGIRRAETSFAQNDIIRFTLDRTTGKLQYAVNSGSFADVTFNATVSTTLDLFPLFQFDTTSTASAVFNFGQRPFSYTPPTGFKALNTFNLPDPTIKKPNQYMDATTYTGNGTSQSITNSGSFQPDLVWTKSRSNAYNNSLMDSVRGVSKALSSDLINAEDNNPGYYVTAFNSNGFSVGLGTGSNGSGSTYVGWQWKKGATAGFDIVTYTGNGSSQNISHSLGVAPKMMVIKNRGYTTAWRVYHQTLGNTQNLRLNLTNAAAVDSGIWNNTSPTSSVFTVGSDGDVNRSGDSHVAYLFAEIPQFSKAFSYTGNGSSDGPMVYCGFRPKFVLIKRTDSAANWYIWDTARDTYNVMTLELKPNLSNAEDSNTDMDCVSNGFKLRRGGVDQNASGGTYIGFAFADSPFKFSLAR